MGWLTKSSPQQPERKGDLILDEYVDGPGRGLLRVLGTTPDPEYPSSNFVNHTAFGYERNELVYACIAEKATSMPEAPLRVYPAGPGRRDANENHRLRVLLDNPNPLLSEYELFEVLSMHLDLAGNAFWEIVRDRAGRVVELWPLRPDYMRMKRAGRRVHYGYAVDGVRVVPVEVVHFRLPSPIDPLVGTAPLRAALRAASVDNLATDHVASLLRNSAMPGVVVKVSELQQALDRETTERLKARWRESYGGRRKGEPAFLQTGMDVQQLGFSLKDLEMLDLRAVSETRICAAFGVPPILVGAYTGLQRCLPADSRVWTTAGPVRIADVKPGMTVWSEVDGHMEKLPVTNWALTDTRPVYTIRTKNRILRASGNHPILVRIPGSLGGGSNDERRVSYGYKRADEIAPGDHVVQAMDLPDQRGFTGPDGSPVSGDLMRWLGAMLGDGSVGSGTIRMAMPPADRCHEHYVALAKSLFTRQARGSGGSSTIQLLVERAPISVGVRERDFGFRSAVGARQMVSLGVSGTAKTKRIPAWVFGLGRELRLELLAGIVDTDGYVDSRGSLTLALCNRDLLEDVRDLLISCGIQCSNIAERIIPASALPNQGLHESYVAWAFTASSAVDVAQIPFTDDLYRQRVEANAQRQKRCGFDAAKAGLDPEHFGFFKVRSVEVGPAEPLYDIEVAGGGHNFIADGVVVSNSTFSNYAEARRSFWEETLMPAHRRIRDAIALQLLPLVAPPGKGVQPVKLRFDYSEVLALRESEQQRYERASRALSGGGITINEFRHEIGLDKTPGGDVFLMPSGVIATRDVDGALEPIAGYGEPTPAPAGDQTDGGDSAKAIEVKALTDAEEGDADAHREVLSSFVAARREVLLAQVHGKASGDRSTWATDLAESLFGVALAAASAAGVLVWPEYDEDRTKAYQWRRCENAAAAFLAGLLDGVKEALADPEPRVAVEAVLDAYEGFRAERVGQTLATESRSWGAEEGGRQAESAGRVSTKSWRVTHKSPRASCKSANGQAVAIGAKFRNGLKHPGDSSKGPDYSAGCTCRLDVEVKEKD